MTHRRVFDAVDRTLRNLQKTLPARGSAYVPYRWHCDGSHEEMAREVMVTMNCDTLPLSVLRLTIGAPVMPLQNLDPFQLEVRRGEMADLPNKVD